MTMKEKNKNKDSNFFEDLYNAKVELVKIKYDKLKPTTYSDFKTKKRSNVFGV